MIHPPEYLRASVHVPYNTVLIIKDIELVYFSMIYVQV